MSTVDTAATLIQIEDVVNRCAGLAMGVADIVVVEDVGGDAMTAVAFVCRSISEQLNDITADLIRLRSEGGTA